MQAALTHVLEKLLLPLEFSRGLSCNHLDDLKYFVSCQFEIDTPAQGHIALFNPSGRDIDVGGGAVPTHMRPQSALSYKRSCVRPMVHRRDGRTVVEGR